MNLIAHNTNRKRKCIKEGKSENSELRENWISDPESKSICSCFIESTSIFTYTFEMCSDKRHFQDGSKYRRIDPTRIVSI